MFSKESATRAHSSSDNIFGEFTRLGDGNYNLNGYGKLRVMNDNMLVVTPNGGEEMRLRAYVERITTRSK